MQHAVEELIEEVAAGHGEEQAEQADEANAARSDQDNAGRRLAPAGRQLHGTRGL